MTLLVSKTAGLQPTIVLFTRNYSVCLSLIFKCTFLKEHSLEWLLISRALNVEYNESLIKKDKSPKRYAQKKSAFFI